jgi:UDP-2,3-diacylglucosamine pyrophosphatase LpxH
LKVIAVSDQHLGYENSDKVAFNQFLEQLQEDNELTDLVLLGDVVDMWRRDSSGVFLENKETVNRMFALRKKNKDLTIHYVAGNHDFHVLRLRNFDYPFNFSPTLTLPDPDCDYVYEFVHGYEFDPLQQEPLMEGLCHVMSDGTGDFESDIWGALTAAWSDVEFILAVLCRNRKNRLRVDVQSLQTRPEDRLKATMGEVEKRACQRAKILQPNGILVFGHTHKPFVNTTETVANTGSWVTDATYEHNTYVELSGGKPRLFVFGGQEITKRIQC